MHLVLRLTVLFFSCDSLFCFFQVDGLMEMDEDATIRCAIQCLQAVTDFRGNEVRAGCVVCVRVSLIAAPRYIQHGPMRSRQSWRGGEMTASVMCPTLDGPSPRLIRLAHVLIFVVCHGGGLDGRTDMYPSQCCGLCCCSNAFTFA